MVKSLRSKPVLIRPRKTKRAKALKKVKVPKAIKSYVNSAISRREENKLAMPYTFNNTEIRPYGYNGVLTSTIINLTQVFTGITQGAQQGQRIGNEIRVKNFTFKGYVNKQAAPTTETNTQYNKPLYLKMIIGRQKATLSAPSDFSNLLQNGATNSTPNNLPSDMYKYINKDAYQVMATRMFKLGNASGPSPDLPNNDFNLAQMFSVNLSKHIHKVKFDDASTTPTNCAYYAWFLLANADGTAMTLGATANNYPEVEIHGDVSLTYEDA